MDLPLQDMIESIGQSVSAAQQRLEAAGISHFFGYFDEGAQGMDAKTVKVTLPAAADVGEDALVEITLVALVHHNHVGLSQVKVRVNAKLFADDESQVKMNLNEAAGENTVELVFDISPPAEGVARVVQNINRKV